MTNDLTLAIIKPDVFEQHKIGEVISMLEDHGYAIVATAVREMSKANAADFYIAHLGQPYFSDLTTFMSAGSVMPMVLKREDAVLHLRKLIGNKKPERAEEGTIRKRFGTPDGGPRNAIHASDSMESARREIMFFFPKFELGV